MLNFIIYEENKEILNFYKMIIINALACHEEEFKIFDFEEYINNKNDNKIYIISTKSYEEALTKTKEIRKEYGWHSQIIIITKCEEVTHTHNNLLILDHINKKENIRVLLKNSVLAAYKILSSEKSFKFSLNGEIYKIPYKEILFIEKRNNQNYCNIVTTNETYKIKSTIKEIEKHIDSACFLKTHRSCIVNLCNVTKYNYSENILYFKDISTDLVSREKRQFLKDKIIQK